MKNNVEDSIKLLSNLTRTRGTILSRLKDNPADLEQIAFSINKHTKTTRANIYNIDSRLIRTEDKVISDNKFRIIYHTTDIYDKLMDEARIVVEKLNNI